VYTGKEYTGNNYELIRVQPDVKINTQLIFGGPYSTLNPQSFPSSSFSSDLIIPTNDDYNKGYFIRYILKPVISSQINDFIEVKSDKYKTVLLSKNLQVLYNSVSLIWKITGPLFDEYKDNIRTRPGIIDTNKRSLFDAEQTMPNLSLYFLDLKQFGKPS
jgi:hypothetical protein